MLSSIFKRCVYRLSVELEDAYSLKYKVKDVTKMRGLKSGEPYVIIQNKRLDLPKNKMLMDILNQSPFNKPNQPLTTSILDINLNLIHPTASTLSILSSNFYIKIQQSLYYIANNEPLIASSFNPQFQATDSTVSLQPVVRGCIKSLGQVTQITPHYFNLLVAKHVMEQSFFFKIQKIRLKQLIKVVEGRLQEFQRQIKVVDQIIKKKSVNKTKFFTTFIATQYAIVHWLIYFHFSWDIMEPITVILANFDLLIGYYFFVFKGRQYSLQGIQKSIYEKHKWNHLKRYGINTEKYEQLLELKQYLQMRLDLHSKSPYVLMDRLELPIKLLDTR